MSPLRWALAALGIAVAILAVWWFVFEKPATDRQSAVQAEAGTIIAKGETAAAKDTIGVTINIQDQKGETNAQGAVNAAAIRSASGAETVAPADADGAGRRALCMRRAYRGSAACQQLLDARP